MIHRRLMLALLIASLACATAATPGVESAGPRGDAKTVTSADLGNATQLDLLSFLAAERPQWLKVVGGRGTATTVYIDDARIGGVSALRTVTLSTVGSVRFFDVSAAQQKFNTRETGPVIQVITR